MHSKVCMVDLYAVGFMGLIFTVSTGEDIILDTVQLAGLLCCENNHVALFWLNSYNPVIQELV